jgi:hypothetical protein
LMRNNEMTMDQFFTHVAWPTRDGRHITTFDERKPLLEKEPIAADAPWVAFLNLDKGYGYGFVMLEYKATKSATHGGIGISDGADNGKYWSRLILSREPTPIEPGDQFEERTAYVLFRCAKDKPLAEFFDWEKKIHGKFGKAARTK